MFTAACTIATSRGGRPVSLRSCVCSGFVNTPPPTSLICWVSHLQTPTLDTPGTPPPPLPRHRHRLIHCRRVAARLVTDPLGWLSIDAPRMTTYLAIQLGCLIGMGRDGLSSLLCAHRARLRPCISFMPSSVRPEQKMNKIHSLDGCIVSFYICSILSVVL